MVFIEKFYICFAKFQNIMNKLLKHPANFMIPGDIFPPGEFIRDEMETRGLKQAELVKDMGISKSEISLVLNGKRNISVAFALKLEKMFGINAEVWMNLQVKYDIEMLRKTLSPKTKKN